MPLHNRVDPFGAIQSVPARGTLMGNRGILHDSTGQLGRSHAHRNWIACLLDFKDRRRVPMSPGSYTELFFLDEATSLAAGHRPCAECRRARYRAFVELWRAVHGMPNGGEAQAAAIDRHLHRHRIARDGRKVIFHADAADIPDGTIFARDGQAGLVWEGAQLDWSFDGYRRRETPVTGPVEVLTPGPVVALFRAGFRPAVHASAATRAQGAGSLRP